MRERIVKKARWEAVGAGGGGWEKGGRQCSDNPGEGPSGEDR